MARAKAEKDSFKAEADKLASKLRARGHNVLVNGLSPNEELMEISMEWPDEPGVAFTVQVGWIVQTPTGFISGEEYIRDRLENHILGSTLLKRQLGHIARKS